ncbi:hypothetical protein WMF01_12250 [Sorangium sp. So ce1667]
MLHRVLFVSLLVAGCSYPGSAELFCETECRLTALEAQGSGGGSATTSTASTSSATTSTASATSSTSSTTSTTTTGGGDGGAGGNGGSGGAGGVVDPPECFADTACSLASPGCIEPHCVECAVGRCLDGRCVAEPANEGMAHCKVDNEDSTRYRMDGWCSAGQCLDYVPVRCETALGTYTGCDGAAHPGQVISWQTDLGGKTECRSSATDAARCDAGTPCVVEYRSADTAFRYEGVCR